MRERAFRRYVDRLAAGRGARRRAAVLTDEQAEQLRTAITLRAAAPGERTPSAAFTRALHQRLAAELEPGPPAPKFPDLTRRRLVQAGSLAAASALAGAALDQVLTDPGLQVADPSEIVPDTGTWRTVATSTDVAGGAVCPFDLGTVTGFVQRRDGHLLAVSGVCTHLGCRLVLSAPTQDAELRCPCHRAAFRTDGAVLRHELPRPLPALPRLAVREINGNIQVYAPA